MQLIVWVVLVCLSKEAGGPQRRAGSKIPNYSRSGFRTKMRLCASLSAARSTTFDVLWHTVEAYNTTALQ